LRGLKAAQVEKSPVEHSGGWRQTKIIGTNGLQRSASLQLTEEIEDLTDLDRLPFRESAKLDSFFERLEKSLLVIQLNIQTLRDISDRYQNLANRDNLPSE
jgi:hypothetical protein